jgi:hypothetical protein
MRIYRENCTALNANQLRHVRSAYLRVDGPVTLGVILHPDTACLVWYWDKQRHNLPVGRVQTRKGKLWVCPKCGWWVVKVLVHPPAIVGCWRCLKPWTRAWDCTGKYREPRTPALWDAWAEKRLKRMAKHHGVRLEEENAPPDPT